MSFTSDHSKLRGEWTIEHYPDAQRLRVTFTEPSDGPWTIRSRPQDNWNDPLERERELSDMTAELIHAVSGQTYSNIWILPYPRYVEVDLMPWPGKAS